MTTALIIGGLVLVGLGLVASQLIRLKDWLDRQPPVEPPPAEPPAEQPRPDAEP
ncbi:MAG TPA: hypothetical protein PKK01_05540 [Mycobacterium sp.]|nr:hypothetical protein [Mycobacterium sp.]HPZ93485.1 hypothetical protein [Mycobacterium sp.]HQE14353.1 hypothetical protein [Mycobacterium sp.]